MTVEELKELLLQVRTTKAESQTLEIKAAALGCPKKLYDTLSSFSNQDDGGILLFGVDESRDFAEVGVYDAQDLITHVTEQCNQMSPLVRPIFTEIELDGKAFVSAEIPSLDVSERPCFYSGRGRLTGSYVRVGVADEPMTEYEVYSFKAFRKKYQDDVRTVERASLDVLDRIVLEDYLVKLRREKPNLAQMNNEQILELMNITIGGIPTMAAVLLFSPYPQAYFPQLGITAIVIPGVELGEVGAEGERFSDNKRIEGKITDMLEGALNFVRTNMKTRTIIDPQSGKRTDKPDYPMTAVREAVLNALVHRDYSIHTEGMPIQLHIYEDRLELRNPGGLYGRIRVDQLGKLQPDTRTPVLAVAMEVLRETENRYSGIPTMRRELKLAGMTEPEFQDIRGGFTVCFRKSGVRSAQSEQPHGGDLLTFCKAPRSRREIADFLGLSSVHYVSQTHIAPLVERGLLSMTIPEKPRSSRQRYFTVEKQPPMA